MCDTSPFQGMKRKRDSLGGQFGIEVHYKHDGYMLSMVLNLDDLFYGNCSKVSVVGENNNDELVVERIDPSISDGSGPAEHAKKRFKSDQTVSLCRGGPCHAELSKNTNHCKLKNSSLISSQTHIEASILKKPAVVKAKLSRKDKERATRNPKAKTEDPSCKPVVKKAPSTVTAVDIAVPRVSVKKRGDPKVKTSCKHREKKPSKSHLPTVHVKTPFTILPDRLDIIEMRLGGKRVGIKRGIPGMSSTVIYEITPEAMVSPPKTASSAEPKPSSAGTRFTNDLEIVACGSMAFGFDNSPAMAEEKQLLVSVKKKRSPMKSNLPLPHTTPQESRTHWKEMPTTPCLWAVECMPMVQLVWDSKFNSNKARIALYQLFACYRLESVKDYSPWRQVGYVKARPLPMACNIKGIHKAVKYYFAMRPVDVYGRYGSFTIQTVYI